MSNKLELRLTGSGGQGLILGGVILAEAAIMEGKKAVQSQSYGPEARGGSSKAEVIISDEEIDFPKVLKTNLLLTLTQKSCNKYIGSLDSEGILLVDSSVIVPGTNRAERVVQIPILETANKVIGKSMVANIISIGAINGILHIASKKSLEAAVLNRVPKGTEDLNKRALETGYKLVENFNSLKKNCQLVG
ncbi:2-oxoacid:acceptor oxidoreductase family protein [Clostridium sp. MT-14]|jgi:2-oxoglutarate ferredoxin oxidoreductase subunit gamma|uniref:2-oxoacid:acceptor oxidoreductase family protein n=1 Tax=unclassified Clostridium TaxID=2614128 RepID=UPI00123BF5B2|nr:2-oxoacid:acceptor oxidoreductase family protein [Clostridium sp. HV4-5-A1G]KAA8676020.1 2-oxoacid:ferredoxin oxidoreductase subunit gamma [Clostridium sp. HV4-5-A1G]CAB1247032.1 2-oxoglutarate synthase subunit KorC [Clostridiaceae bacterium BL-3]